jgi:hypothetical protein
MLLPMLLSGMGLLSFACSSMNTPHGAEDFRGQTAKSGGKTKMKITIGSKTFVGTLEDNRAANELKSRLPLRLIMTDLHANEKLFDLPKPLPTDAKQPGTIRTGDLLLYGDRTLVLFYKTFKSSYSYTRIGRIDDPSGLATAVGTGSVGVAFEAK